jgi:hypothetical protein
MYRHVNIKQSRYKWPQINKFNDNGALSSEFAVLVDDVTASEVL